MTVWESTPRRAYFKLERVSRKWGYKSLNSHLDWSRLNTRALENIRCTDYNYYESVSSLMVMLMGNLTRWTNLTNFESLASYHVLVMTSECNIFDGMSFSYVSIDKLLTRNSIQVDSSFLTLSLLPRPWSRPPKPTYCWKIVSLKVPSVQFVICPNSCQKKWVHSFEIRQHFYQEIMFLGREYDLHDQISSKFDNFFYTNGRSEGFEWIMILLTCT